MNKPPSLLRALLAWCAPAAHRPEFLLDLDEGYAARYAAQGRLHALRWLLVQTAISAIPLLRLRLSRRMDAPAPRARWRDLASDLRLALRLARRNRLTTAAVVVTMILGVSVTTAVFSIVNGVLLRPLPFAQSERVVQFGMTMRSGDSTLNLSWPDVQDFRSDARAFRAVTAASMSGIALTEGDAPQQLELGQVDREWPKVFRTRMQLGRFFVDEEFASGGRRAVILTDATWSTLFGRDASIVGRAISLGGEPREVVGVLHPDAYLWPSQGIQLLVPLIVRPGTFQLNRGAGWLFTAGLLRDGTSVAAARNEVSAIDARLIAAFPDAKQGLAVWVTPLRDFVVGDVRTMLILLTAAVGAVLLIVCVNVANVLLVQAAARTREFAVRTALGGSRARLRRQLLTEGMLLSAFGGAIGAALAPSLTRALVAMYPGRLPRGQEVHVDGTMLLVAMACTLIAGLLSVLPTFRRAGAAGDGVSLVSRARVSTSARERNVTRGLLVGQVALSLALLFAAGLLVQTFQRVSATSPGFRASGLLTFAVSPSSATYRDMPAVSAFYSSLGERLLAIPGVTHVATANEVPFSGFERIDVFVQPERGDRGAENPQVRIGVVSPELFGTLGLPVLGGRPFNVADGERAPRVVVINESLRRRFYPDGDAIGRTIDYERATWTIVGVVGSARMRGLTQPEIPELFLPQAQLPSRRRYVIARVAVPAAQVIGHARTALAALDPMLPMTEVATIEERMQRDVAPQRYRASLVGALGVVALVLVAVGLYGMVSYGVSRQVREIGIRMALGEARGQVWRRVVSESLQVAVLGVATGMALSFAVQRWLASVVVGVRPDDPGTFAVVALLLVFIAIAAAAVPARRATRVDPATSLRSE